jgi:cytochrome P450
MRTVHRRVDQIIQSHRESSDWNDLLSSLMSPSPGGGADGPPMTAAELRSQTVTLLFAGHETTANALTWLFYLLSQHADADARVHAEAASLCGGRDLTPDDLGRLAYTGMTIRETLRLYTPIWAIVRRATADDEVDGYRLPAGSMVVISPHATHRHPHFWESPEAFDPSRFAPDRAAAMHPFAYIPFGAGGRYCVGRELAKLEMLVISTMVTRRYRLALAPGQRVEAAPGITLRARYGMTMLLESR